MNEPEWLSNNEKHLITFGIAALVTLLSVLFVCCGLFCAPQVNSKSNFQIYIEHKYPLKSNEK